MQRTITAAALALITLGSLSACGGDDDASTPGAKDQKCLTDLKTLSPIDSIGGGDAPPAVVDGVAYTLRIGGEASLTAHDGKDSEPVTVEDATGARRFDEILGVVDDKILIAYQLEDGKTYVAQLVGTDGSSVWRKESPEHPSLLVPQRTVKLGDEFLDAATGKAVDAADSPVIDLLPLPDGDDAVLTDRSSGVDHYLDTDVEWVYLTKSGGKGEPWKVSVETGIGLCGDYVYLAEGNTLAVHDIDGSHDEPISELELPAEAGHQIAVGPEHVAVKVDGEWRVITG